MNLISGILNRNVGGKKLNVFNLVPVFPKLNSFVELIKLYKKKKLIDGNNGSKLFLYSFYTVEIKLF